MVLNNEQICCKGRNSKTNTYVAHLAHFTHTLQDGTTTTCHMQINYELSNSPLLLSSLFLTPRLLKTSSLKSAISHFLFFPVLSRSALRVAMMAWANVDVSVRWRGVRDEPPLGRRPISLPSMGKQMQRMATNTNASCPWRRRITLRRWFSPILVEC